MQKFFHAFEASGMGALHWTQLRRCFSSLRGMYRHLLHLVRYF